MLTGVATVFEEAGKLTIFSVRTFAVLFTRRVYWEEFLLQLYKVLAGSIFVVVLISAFVGANVVVQGYQMLAVLGADSLTGMFVGLAVVRELGPVLAGAMVGAKAGCEVASEIASMRIQQQIDALEVMSVNPIQYLVVPRLLAMTIGLPLMLGFSIIAAIGAGWLVARFQFGMNTTIFMEQLSRNVSQSDLSIALMKTFFFGLASGLVECYQGFQAKPGPTGVGEATNQSIVVGAVMIAWINLVITAIVY